METNGRWTVPGTRYDCCGTARGLTLEFEFVAGMALGAFEWNLPQSTPMVRWGIGEVAEVL